MAKTAGFLKGKQNKHGRGLPVKNHQHKDF